MPVPETLQSLIDEALQMVEQHPDHEYGPMNRKKLMDAFRALDTPLADKARRWLGVVTARHVLSVHREPLYPEDELEQEAEYRARISEDELREFDARYEEPAQAIALAERVLRGEFDANEAYRIVNNAHYALGYYRTVPSMFAQGAANKALLEASASDYDAFAYLSSMASSGSFFMVNYRPEDLEQDAVVGSNFTDVEWATSGQADSAAEAALAWSCVVDASKVDPDDWPENWNAWINEKAFDRDKLLDFWRWWLTDAIPQAWAIAEEQLRTSS